MVRKQELLQINQNKISMSHPAAKDLDEMELFRTFKKYDRNSKGVLEFSLFCKCLEESTVIKLTRQEALALSLAANVNGDGDIDYEEFMKHFTDTLNMFNMHHQLTALLQDEENRKVREKEMMNF